MQKKLFDTINMLFSYSQAAEICSDLSKYIKNTLKINSSRELVKILEFKIYA